MQKPPDEPAADGEDDFFLEIESRFAQLRATPFIFSSKDWALMKSWQLDGIPLSIVLEALDTSFTKREESKRRGKISSLSYCRHAVEELWEERKHLYVGRESALAGDASPQQQLAALASDVRAAAADLAAPLQRMLNEAAEAVEQLHEGRTTAEIENELMSIEQTLLDRAAGDLEKQETTELEEEIRKALSSFGAGDAAVIEKSRAAIWKRAMRKRLNLPRLSLFT